MSGTCTDTTSATRNSASSVSARSMPDGTASAARYGSNAAMRIPNAPAIRATRLAMRPKPTSPSTLPSSSIPAWRA